MIDLVRASFFEIIQTPVYERLKGLIGVISFDMIEDFVLFNAKNYLGIESVTSH